ncbi:nucleotidyltransferase domain-containing protein [Cellulomonas endophytica]|uniref:nucleotidyltransferase domain-containing protein n=1 Tax=Cellulomonas endophytica TaxID=2494735 RepID=UPI001013C056|nr:amino acid transporter [Cellulomonas endophytica]
MDADEVLRVLDALAAAGARAWVSGGWGVDALVGRRTRPHRDLDLALDAADEAQALTALAALGYAVETDHRPVRVELAATGQRWVDLHPVAFAAAADADARAGAGASPGDGVQAGPPGTVFLYPASCFVTGTVAGRTVGCLDVAQQLRFHSGYPPGAVDLHDLALLHALAEDRPPAPP